MAVNEGSAVVSYANETELKPILGNNIPSLDQGTFKAELPLPSNLTVGIAYKPVNTLNLTGEVQFVGWGAYKELDVHFFQDALEFYNINAPKNYKNSRIYRIGGEYATTNRLDIRVGFYFDESPVKDAYLNPETPSMNRLGATAGLSFRPLESLSVDFAFAYITGFGRDGSYTDPSNPKKIFGGHYEVQAINPTIGLSYSF
jgi:long-chain fatty acid transport protein